jgi:DNA-binding MarR family transcriptional regulator
MSSAEVNENAKSKDASSMKARTTAIRVRRELSKRGETGGKAKATGGQLAKVLALIKARPGIRPSEINRRLNLEQSDALRDVLIKRGLIRKVKDGSAMRYYPM